MKKVFKTLQSFVKYNKTFCMLLGVIAFCMLIGLCSCNNVGDEQTYPVVAGVYEIVEGTQEIITPDDQEVRNLEGSIFPVSQNKGVVYTLACLGKLEDDGVVECADSENWNIDGWYGPYVGIVTGTLEFGSDGALVMQTQIEGNYIEYDFSYTMNFDLKAQVVGE